jgi:hypothetical protein
MIVGSACSDLADSETTYDTQDSNRAILLAASSRLIVFNIIVDLSFCCIALTVVVIVDLDTLYVRKLAIERLKLMLATCATSSLDLSHC